MEYNWHIAIEAILASIIVSYAIFKTSLFKKRSTENIFRTLFDYNNKEASFYFYDKNSNKSFFSPFLKNLFLLENDDHYILDLKNFISEGDLTKLNQFYQELISTLLNPISENAIINSGNRKKKITLSGNVGERKKIFFECIGDIIISEQGSKIGAIIWFDDITEEAIYQKKIITENEKLRLEVKKLNNLLNSSPYPIWERDINNNICYFNLAYNNLIVQELDKTFDSEMLELSKHSKALAIEVNSTRKTKSDNFHIIIDGKRNLFNITEIPVENSGSVGFAFDITSKEKIKQELDRYISAQSDLLESSSSAMAIYSADTRIRYFNQAFMKLWNLDEKYLATHPTYGEILEELREKRKLPEQSNFPAFKQKHLKLFTNLIDPYNEFFYLPDGTALRVLIIPHALGGLLFAYEDMTNHLALERSYNTSIAVQKTTLDNLHEGIAVFGANGRLKLSNPIFAKLWNFSQEFLDTEPHINEITDKIKSYFNEDNWNEVKENLFIALVKRDRSKLIMERNDGTVIKRISLPLPDGALLITHLDITDSMRVERSLRERNEALQEADKTKTEFLANISYEFRSPLTSIMGLSEVLDKLYFGELNEKQKEYVVGIYKSSQYLMSLVNDILDLASIEAGYMKLELSRFDIYQSINSLIPLFKERIKEANINFKFNCVPYFGLVIADEKRIKQVVFKLISNSIKFNKNGGNIILSVKEVEGTKISISVEDTGVGIDKEEQERVFNKFYKISSNKIGKSGAGLGLSVVKSFIELHYGTVHIESNEDNVSGTKIICIFDRENKILSEIVDKENKLLEFA